MEKILTKEISGLDQRFHKYLNAVTHLEDYFNLTQIHVLVYLVRHIEEDVCQKDLEIEMGLKKATITGLIDVLNEKGFVYRVQAEDDRRKNYIKLTQKAMNYKDEIYARLQELNGIVKKEISSEELGTFFRTIEKINRNMDDAIQLNEKG
ncbi:MAG: MarR family transcriptional regulator [Erysipelotrichaceae bacterium]|nr:MarR family transcriptional regulator [Erysipelotrichaceae bacterium]